MGTIKTYICPNCGGFIENNYTEESIDYVDEHHNKIQK